MIVPKYCQDEGVRFIMETGTNGASRRDFLKVATGAASAVVVGAGSAGAKAQTPVVKGPPATAVTRGITHPVADAQNMKGGIIPKGTVMATGRAIGANDRIILGFIGLGGQGTNGHLRGFVDDGLNRNTKVVAGCDLYDAYNVRGADIMKKAADKGGDSNPFMTRDYTKLIARKDIDAIVISTPEHWHSQIAIHAMQAGKHVYIEKPLSRYVDEAFQVLDVANSTKRVVQVGSQGCSDVRWHAAAKAIKDGRIGSIVMGQGSYCRNNPKGEWNYEIHDGISPENFDWDLWLGSAPRRPWTFDGYAKDGDQFARTDSGARFRRYRKYNDYSGGILGDLMPHKLHPFLIASGNPEYPTRVTSLGTNSVHGPNTKHNDREVADTVQVLAEFPSGWSMLFVGSTVNEQGLQDMIRGDKGTVYFGNGVEVKIERPYAEDYEGGKVDTNDPALAKYAPFENIPAHEKNWLDCIRRGDVNTNCSAELATKVQTIISLAEISERKGKAVSFDAKTRKITV